MPHLLRGPLLEGDILLVCTQAAPELGLVDWGGQELEHVLDLWGQASQEEQVSRVTNP